MSRTSTSTTKTSSPSRCDPSPVVSVPSLSRETTRPSPPESLPSFSAEAIDDFVLFPEETSFWNPADISIPEFDCQDYDLSQFNFDINGLDDFPTMSADQSFDFPSWEQPAASSQLNRLMGHNQYAADQCGLDQWASPQGDLLVSQSKPHHSISSQDSSQLDSSWLDSIFQATESATSQDTSLFAENYSPDGHTDHPQLGQASSPQNASSTSVLDWSLLDPGIIAMSPEEISTSSSMNRKERRKKPRVERARNAAIERLVELVPSAHSGESRTIVDSSGLQHPAAGSFSSSPTHGLYDHGQSYSLGASIGGSLEYWALENTHVLVQESLQALKSAPAAYQPIYEELKRLRNVLINVKSGHTDSSPVLQQAMVSQLRMLTSQLQVLLTRVKLMLRTSRLSYQQQNSLDPEYRPDYVRQCSLQTRHLVSRLCATITNLEERNIGFGGTVSDINTPVVLSGGNVQPAIPLSENRNGRRIDLWEAVEQMLDGSSSSMSSSGSVSSTSFHGGDVHAGLSLGSGSAAISTTSKVPRYSLVTKSPVEQISRIVEGLSDGTSQSNTPSFSHIESGSVGTPVPSASQARRLYLLEQLFQRPPHGLSQTVLSSVQDWLDTESSSNRRVCQVLLDQTWEEFSPHSTVICNKQSVQSILQTDQTILPGVLDSLQQLGASSLHTPVAQNVENSCSDPLPQCSEASSPSVIPGAVLDDNETWCNDDTLESTGRFDMLASYVAVLLSLVLLNAWHVTALFRALPRPIVAPITALSFCCVLAQFFLPNLITGFRSFITLVMMYASLMKKSKNLSNGFLDVSLWFSTCPSTTFSIPQFPLPLSGYPSGNPAMANPAWVGAIV